MQIAIGDFDWNSIMSDDIDIAGSNSNIYVNYYRTIHI